MAHNGNSWYNGHGQSFAQGLAADMQALFTCVVHHIQGQHQGAAQLAQLQGQLQMAFKC